MDSKYRHKRARGCGERRELHLWNWTALPSIQRAACEHSTRQRRAGLTEPEPAGAAEAPAYPAAEARAAREKGCSTRGFSALRPRFPPSSKRRGAIPARPQGNSNGTSTATIAPGGDTDRGSIPDLTGLAGVYAIEWNTAVSVARAKSSGRRDAPLAAFPPHLLKPMRRTTAEAPA
jgi:hypothetical protein